MTHLLWLGQTISQICSFVWSSTICSPSVLGFANFGGIGNIESKMVGLGILWWGDLVKMVGLGMVVEFGNFTTIQYLATIIGMAQENFMSPPPYSSEISGYLKLQYVSLKFQIKVTQNFKKFQKISQSLNLKRIIFSSKNIMH